MKIETVHSGKCKVTLTADDMKSLELEYDRLGSQDVKTRLALLELLTRARVLTGFDGFSSRLSIEAIPQSPGGCIFYFTIISEPQGPCTEQGPLVVSAFPNADALLAAAHSLQKKFGALWGSALYQHDQRYYLLLHPPQGLRTQLENMLSEFSESASGIPSPAFLAEHGRLLCREDAVSRLSGR